MAEKGELNVGDMVRYWARTATSIPELDGYVGEVIGHGRVGEWIYIRWLPNLSTKDRAGTTYGANPENLDKIDLLP